MANIKITCVSTADLSEQLLTKYNIDVTPLYIILEDKSYCDSIDIQPEDIYEYAERTGKLPKTAAVSVQNYIDFFSKYKKNLMRSSILTSVQNFLVHTKMHILPLKNFRMSLLSIQKIYRQVLVI